MRSSRNRRGQKDRNGKSASDDRQLKDRNGKHFQHLEAVFIFLERNLRNTLLQS